MCSVWVTFGVEVPRNAPNDDGRGVTVGEWKHTGTPVTD
jgi:hypothetical protein